MIESYLQDLSVMHKFQKHLFLCAILKTVIYTQYRKSIYVFFSDYTKKKSEPFLLMTFII